MKRTLLWIVIVVTGWAGVAAGQTLRFDEHRERRIPDTANLRLGPFSSDFAFSLSAGYRYVTTSGEGSGYLYQNERGRVLKDGSDLPLMAGLSFRNYLIISKYMDLDVSFTLGYRYFPMDTEEDEFVFDVEGPAIVAQMGSFNFAGGEDAWMGNYTGGRAQAGASMRGGEEGFSATVSSDFQLTPFVRGRIHDSPSYRTDYVDERGVRDSASGQKYTAFQNLLGLDMDWLMAKDKNLAYSGNRIDTIPREDEFDVQRSVVYNQGVAYQQQLNPVAAGGVRANYIWRQYEEGRGEQFQQDYAAFLGADLSENTSLQTALGYSMAELTADNAWETNGTSDTVIGMIRLRSQLGDKVSHQAGYERSQRGGFDGGFEVVDALDYSIALSHRDWIVAFLTSYQMVEPRLYRASDYTDWLNQVTVARPLNRYLTLTLATAYTIRDNGESEAGDAGAGELLVENSYDTWTSTMGLTYAITDHLAANGYVEHLERFGDTDAVAFTRDTAGVMLTYSRDL